MTQVSDMAPGPLVNVIIERSVTFNSKFWAFGNNNYYTHVWRSNNMKWARTHNHLVMTQMFYHWLSATSQRYHMLQCQRGERWKLVNRVTMEHSRTKRKS
jgi:hypothetical protein